MGTSFTPKAMTFLRGLAKHNDRDWFEARREVYESELRAPMLALVDGISTAMAGFAPEHMRPPHKVVMRIYRDIRFSSDKRPYKTHLSAWWSRRGMEKTSGGGYYLQISPKELVVAAGVYMPEREQLLQLRNWMAEHHAQYRAELAKLLKPRGAAPVMGPIDSAALKRMPRGFAPDHPADDLLRSTNWGVHASLPFELALEPAFSSEIIKRFRRCAPLVAMLNGAIAAKPEVAEQAGRIRL